MEAPHFIVERIQSVSTTSMIERYIFNSDDKGAGEERRNARFFRDRNVRRKFETKIRETCK